MKIKINDVEVQTPIGSTVADALAAQGIDPVGKALALNGKVVPKGDYSETMLSEGDSILIIKAFYGG